MRPVITVFADQGVRRLRHYHPDGKVRVESTQWRGMSLQSRSANRCEHSFADGVDLLDEPLGLGDGALAEARRVLLEPLPGPGADGPGRPAGEADRTDGSGPGPDLDGWLGPLAAAHRVRVTWAEFRQRVATGGRNRVTRDERGLSTVEVVDAEQPGCSCVVQWDPRDVPGSRSRVEQAALEVRELAALPAVELPDGHCDVVLDPGCAGSVFHELVGHPLEADVVASGSSYLAGRTGLPVAPGWFSVTDGAAEPGEGVTAKVDDEGVRIRPVSLIDSGRVGAPLCDGLSGSALDLGSNGHGRRLDYRHPLIPRMWHTRATSSGVAAEEPTGAVRLRPRGLGLRWMNLLTGDVEFAAASGLLDTGDGRVRRTGPCTIAGNAVQLLAALRPGPATVRGGGRAAKGCGKLGQFPLVTTFANCGVWFPGEAVDVRGDAGR